MLNFIQNFVGKGKFEVSLNSKNEYYLKWVESIENVKKRYFVLKAKNGEIIGTSETYNSLSNVVSGIDSVRKFSQTQEVKFI